MVNPDAKLLENRRGIAPIFIILIVALLIGGGYFVVRKYVAPKPSAPPTTQTQSPSDDTSKPVTTPSTTQTQQPSDDISNWETYINTQYGFEFKYPKRLTISQNENRIVVDDPQDVGKEGDYSGTKISVSSKPYQSAIQDYLANFNQPDVQQEVKDSIEQQTVTIGGVTSTAISSFNEAGWTDVWIFVPAGNNTVIMYNLNPNDPIRSTFKFLK